MDHTRPQAQDELVVCAVQMCSGPDRDGNLRIAGELVARAAARGARLVVLPENFAQMGRSERDKLAIRERPGSGPVQDFLASTAARHGIVLVGGSVFLACEDADRVAAAALAYGTDGRLLARYDKIHLFDVELPGERYRESATIRPGPLRPVVFDALGTRIGLSICFDLRFPELYRALVADGAELLLAPSAFTEATGRAHWQVLLRARAIENLCAVIAPNQCGRAASGRRTWGHSAIVDPWGAVLAELDEQPGLAVAQVDLGQLRALRRRFPALALRRLPS